MGSRLGGALALGSWAIPGATILLITTILKLTRALRGVLFRFWFLLKMDHEYIVSLLCQACQ